MAELRNNFTAGKMNLDIDERLLQKGEYRTASNIRIANSNGSDVGAIEKSLSNEIVTNLDLGENIFTIGGVSDEFKEKLYWLVKSDSGSYIIEHDVANNQTTFVLKDTRTENVLGLDENYLVTGIVIVVDTDNNNRFLIYTDYNKQPRCINIERAKLYGENNFIEEEILLIKRPPIDPPLITLSKTETEEENNIEEKFLIFFYRYKSLDGEYSAFSPASKVAFKPKSFNYDFSTSTNESMVNDFNLVNIQINTGSKLVTDIEIIFKESQHNNLYLVEKYSKKNTNSKNWLDNANETIQFSNNKIYKTISENQLFRLFDAVPLKAKALAVINNLIVFGNYTENWNLIDENDDSIDLQMQLDVVSEETTFGSSFESNKSNRDYEVGFVYGENYGRHTTIITGTGNNVHIPSGACNKKNNLKLTLSKDSKPPKFADWFRVCIKQNRHNYETIVPTLFYQEGAFVWIKLESADVDKIKVGDFVYVKSDSQGILSKAKQTKIIEIEKKERNFLEIEETTTIKQQSGTYYKIKPKGFRINIQDIDIYEHTSYEDTLNDGSTNPIGNNINYIQKPIYYGDSGLNDLSKSGTYTHNEDIRYLIEIDGIGDNSTTYNTFRWSKDNGSTFESEDIAITAGVSQTLDNGVEITFNSNYGHSTSDYWYIGAKSRLDSGLGNSEGDRGYSIYKGSEDDIIYGGARIEFIYDEYNNESNYVEKTFISSTYYENIEEWFYGDNIIDEIDIDESRIWFRRGNVIPAGWRNRSHQINVTDDDSGTMNLIIKSQGFVNNPAERITPGDVRVRITFNIRQTENVILLETKSADVDSDIFFEIGRTYPIVNGFHTSGFDDDINQTANQDLEITLPHYNCFAWGNGFESIKIKDLFNADAYKFETRPNAPIENYRQNNRIAGLRRGQPYSQTLNYNGLNEFNLSLNINKDLDDSNGAIQIIDNFNGDLDVYQEDKVSKALFNKTVLYNQDGTSNLSQSDLPFNTVIPYAGEFGISTSPEGFAKYGNFRYFPDEKRGVWLRKGQSGIEIISNNGMVDWFRDYFRNNKGEKNLSAYDPYYGQLTIAIKGFTLTFDEKVKGFTSFHSIKPDFMLRLNNDFYTIKNGQLYKQNVEGIGYNNFYGEQFASSVTTYFNDESSLDKIYKTLVLESTNSWKAILKTNYTESHIKSAEFNQRESRWFAYIRKSENETDLNAVSQGLGSIQNINGLELEFVEIPQNVSVNDELWQVVNDIPEKVGVVNDIQGNVLTIDAFFNAAEFNTFCFTKKDSRIEGSELRGYYLEVKLEDDTTEKNELYAISSVVSKSYL